MRSVRYGMTIDHLLSLDLALATGEVLSLGPLDTAQLAAKQKQDMVYTGSSTSAEIRTYLTGVQWFRC